LSEVAQLRAEIAAERTGLIRIACEHADTRTLAAIESFLAVPNWARQPHAGCS
jgi:hypothetical protein